MPTDNPFPKVVMRLSQSPAFYHLIEVTDNRPGHGGGTAVLQFKHDTPRELIMKFVIAIAGLGVSG